MTQFIIIGEIFSSGKATLYKNPSDQTVIDGFFPPRIWTFTSKPQRRSLKMIFKKFPVLGEALWWKICQLLPIFLLWLWEPHRHLIWPIKISLTNLMFWEDSNHYYPMKRPSKTCLLLWPKKIIVKVMNLQLWWFNLLVWLPKGLFCLENPEGLLQEINIDWLIEDSFENAQWREVKQM